MLKTVPVVAVLSLLVVSTSACSDTFCSHDPAELNKPSAELGSQNADMQADPLYLNLEVLKELSELGTLTKLSGQEALEMLSGQIREIMLSDQVIRDEPFDVEETLEEFYEDDNGSIPEITEDDKERIQKITEDIFSSFQNKDPAAAEKAFKALDEVLAAKFKDLELDLEDESDVDETIEVEAAEDKAAAAQDEAKTNT